MTKTDILQDGDPRPAASRVALAYVRFGDLLYLLPALVTLIGLVASYAIGAHLVPELDPFTAYHLGLGFGVPAALGISGVWLALQGFHLRLRLRCLQHHDDLYLHHIRSRGADDPQRADHLCDLLRSDPEPHHREVIATTLTSALLGEAHQRVSRALVDTLKHDPDPRVRGAAVTGLSASPPYVGDHLTDLIDSLRNDRHPGVRLAVAKALRCLADNAVTDAMLEALIHEPHEDVSFWLRDALRWRLPVRPGIRPSIQTPQGVH